ncbi:conserved Plasmodium protein, unknown function [Plasmodium yoelii]|nr:conserved Plasmodium protein, unknown function [Plasmodium yoelii]CDU19618.1 conserved Plasmodium protein, unknown function [Plasmodium yoelii]VTZ80254.1 conserved Plasmodium protein, unknown function [Plasmodium yoelii]|eukprot:XP_022812741.1 conserved Plasmodium protein, unknown function [Plasmodium yoelii]
MQDINNISNIEELLCFFDYFIKNGHSITIIWVKFTLNISSDLSQKIMNYYFQKRKEELCVTYLVEGYINNGDEYTYAVISENDIESVKKEGTYIINIYSLQAKNNKVNFPMLWMQDLNEINKRIVSKNGIYEKLNDFVYEYEKSDSPWDYLSCSPTKRDKNVTPKKKLITNPDLKSSIIVSANRSVSKESKEFLALVSPKKLIEDCNILSNSVSKKSSKSSSVSKKPKQNNTGTNDDKMNDQIKYSKIVKREKYDTNIFNEVSTGLSKNEQNNSIAKNDAQKETIKKTEINKRDEYCLFDQDIPDKNTASNESEIEVSQNLSENEHKQDLLQPSKYNTELTKIKLEESTESNKSTECLDPDNIESDNMKKVKLDKETELFFENGYLVTVDKEPPIKKNLIKSFANEPSSDNKKKSTDNKKKRNLQQTLLTNFFKKKK